MSQGGGRAATADPSGGTPFSTAVNEDSGTFNLQTVAGVGNKSTYTETGRTGINAVDSPANGDLSTTVFAASGLVSCGNAMTAAIRATCDTASQTLTGRLVFYDSLSNPLGMSDSIQFTSDPTLRLAVSGNYVSPRKLVDLGNAVKTKFFVDGRTGGTWAVYIAPI